LYLFFCPEGFVSEEICLIAAGVIIDTKNWPFFFPIMHHDIAADIPENLQWTQRLAYWTYLGKRSENGGLMSLMSMVSVQGGEVHG
jgi:hypothetical protein